MEKSLKTAEAISEIYKIMGYSAANVGLFDLSAGFDFIKKLEKITWVSSNFLTKESDYIFNGYTILDIGSSKIGITGTTSKPDKLNSNIVFNHWQLSLPPVIEALNEKSDFIILLSTLSTKENKEIAKKFPQIRVILSSSPSHSNLLPLQEENTIISQTGSRGKYLGHLIIKNPLFSFADSILEKELKAEQHRLHSTTRRLQRLSMTDTETNNEQVDLLMKKREESVEKIKLLEKSVKNQQNKTMAEFTSQFIALSKRFTEDAEINSIIRQLKDKK